MNPLRRFSIILVIVIPLAAVTALGAGLAAGVQTAWQDKVATNVLSALELQDEAEFIVFMQQQTDLSAAYALGAREEKGRYVFEQLRETARRSQQNVLAQLRDSGAAYRPYWIANMIWVRGDRTVLESVAANPEVVAIYANPYIRLSLPLPAESPLPYPPSGIEPNLSHIRVPQVWLQGVTGQGVVIGGQDTGYDWDHPALLGKYRGWNGTTADHSYNWHDAIHSGGGGCGADSPEPCDDFGHGTHTLGIMVGDDGGANQIGVAPGAKWIGCRNMNQGVGSPMTYSECFQWFLAPTDANGANPDPSLAPHVVNNSWACPPSEGCNDAIILQTVVENVRAAGIVVVSSAGNYGGGCGTVQYPPAIYDASFSVGATDNSDNIAGFSSRGPVTADGSNRLKPDVVAPGVGIRSSLPGGGYGTLSGTSMAAPHVAGLVALLISTNPLLAGDVDSVEAAIRESAAPLTGVQECGGVSGSTIPNNTYGYGRIDALDAFIDVDLPHRQYIPYTAGS